MEKHLFLEDDVGLIKPANYEAQKTKKFKHKLGRIENMAYDAEAECPDGAVLPDRGG